MNDSPPTRLRVRSGSLRGYNGPGRLDVTRGSGSGPGLAFAPTCAILDPCIAERHKAVELLRRADKLRTGRQLFAAIAAEEATRLEAEAWRIENAAWEAYVPLFTSEMRVSAGLSRSSPRWGSGEDAAVARGVVPQPEAWRALLAGKLGSYDTDGAPYVVACCWCEPPFRAHCHSRILAGTIWPALGAEDGGEANGTGVVVARACR